MTPRKHTTLLTPRDASLALVLVRTHDYAVLCFSPASR